MKILTVGLAAATFVFFVTACAGGGASPTDAQRLYVAEICEPFAQYVEGALELGFPEFEGATTTDDVLSILGRLKGIAEFTRDSFVAVVAPEDMREMHEKIIEVLEAEIGGFELMEAAFETGDPEVIEETLSEVDQLASLADIGATGFIPEGVPSEYETAWIEECGPRLDQVPGAGE